jgi:hypothetical protein
MPTSDARVTSNAAGAFLADIAREQGARRCRAVDWRLAKIFPAKRRKETVDERYQEK